MPLPQQCTRIVSSCSLNIYVQCFWKEVFPVIPPNNVDFYPQKRLFRQNSDALFYSDLLFKNQRFRPSLVTSNTNALLYRFSPGFLGSSLSEKNGFLTRRALQVHSQRGDLQRKQTYSVIMCTFCTFCVQKP